VEYVDSVPYSRIYEVDPHPGPDEWTPYTNTLFIPNCIKIKEKQSHYRPGQALRVPGVGGFQI